MTQAKCMLKFYNFLSIRSFKEKLFRFYLVYYYVPSLEEIFLFLKLSSIVSVNIFRESISLVILCVYVNIIQQKTVNVNRLNDFNSLINNELLYMNCHINIIEIKNS